MEAIAANGRIVDSVYTSLRDAILGGRLKPGEPLSVPELARRLGVSRSPVREAVLQIVADGLGVSTPRKGAIVAEAAGDSLLALHDIREVLEGLAARRAARLITADQLENLRSTLRKQKTAVSAHDVHLYRETDRVFHISIADICAEPRLVTLLRNFRDQMRLAVSVALTNPEHLSKGYAEHLAIVSALAAKHPHKAEKAMRAHIAASKARVAERLEARGSKAAR
jgi:DNA-binding GntR family transcriptional regulator